MKLSVVIPCYNAAEHIGAQLSALSRQLCHRSWEVVVADNGSTDATIEAEAQKRHLGSRISSRDRHA